MTPLQEAIFNLICEIDDVCRKNSITYYLHAGSVIGAVRHNSIIPWDDDIDIAITRANWVKLKPLLKNISIKNRALVTPEDYDDFLFTYPQYKNTSTAILVKSGAFYSFPMGMIVDIIILDPVKGDERSIERHKENLKLLAELRCNRFVLNRNTNWTRYKIYKFLERFLGRECILNHLEKRLEKVSDEKCDGYIQRVGIYPVFWEKKFFSKPEYAEIEGRRFPVPTNTEEYLRYTYGDGWMKFPPKPDRRLTHSFEFDLNYSFEDIQNDFQPFIDTDRYRREWHRYKYWRARAVASENNVRISNSKYMAEINACKINKELENIDFEFVFIQNQYQKMYGYFENYFRLQLSKRYIKDEIAVPVKDDVFYYACLILILKGEYEKADQIVIINRQLKRNLKLISKLEEAIDLSRELSIAIYDNKWNCKDISELIKIGLPKYPHHVDFIAAKCALLLHSGEKVCAKRVIDICREELIYHPNSDILQKYLADAKMVDGHKAEAIFYYKKIYNETDNGMLRLKVENSLRKNEVDIIDNLMLNNDFDDEYEIEKEEELYRKSNILLSEINEICKKAKISFFLSGSLISAALNNTKREKELSYYIVMHPADRKEFLNAMQRQLPENRRIESLESNSKYPDFSIKYCDINTIDFDLRSKGFYDINGVNITIYFIRPIDKRKYVRILKRMLYTTVEAIAYPSPFNCYSKKKVIAGCLGRIAKFFLGSKLIKKIAWKIIFTPGSTERKVKGRIKDFWSTSIKLPTLNFSKCKYCNWNGESYPIPVNYVKYMKAQLLPTGAPYIRKTTSKLPYVVEFDTFCNDLNKKLDALKLKRKYFRANKKLYKCNKAFRIETSYLNYAWNIILRSASRFRLYKKYAPLKEKILKYYQEENYLKLEEILSEYIKELEDSDKRGLSISFDQDIFNIACYILKKQGKSDLVKRLIAKVPKEHLKQMSYLCGGVSDMKKARRKDKKYILKYLEKDIENCLYMYADIVKYGVNGRYITVWYDTDDIGIRMVVMKYHDNFQVYTNRGFDSVEGVLQLIDSNTPLGIFGRKEIICNLSKCLSQRYKADFGVIFKGKEISIDKLKMRIKQCNVDVVAAKRKDVTKIAKLLCMDKDMGSVHTEKTMSKELLDRMRTKMGRSYIIRDGNRIVAHNSTYAECDKFVVVSGLMVHPDFRDTDYAYWLDLKSSLEFQKEGKKRYFFALNDRVIHWHKTIKTPVAGEYGKLSLINKI